MERMTGRTMKSSIITLLLAALMTAFFVQGCSDEEPRHNNIPISLYLQRVTTSTSDRTIDQSVEALIAIGEPGVPYLVKVWKKHDDVAIRCRLATVFEEIGPAAAPAVPLLVKALNSLDEQMVSCAAYALGGIGTAAAPAADRLGSLLRSSDSTTQVNLLYALGAIGQAAEDQIPLVMEAANRERTRDAAIDALGQMGSKAVEAIQVWLDTGSREQKLGALKVLADAGQADQVSTNLPKLAEMLKDTDPMVRGAAVRAIGKARQDAARVHAQLIDVLGDRDENVRRDAIQALINLGPEMEPDRLIAALDDRRADVREGAALVIGRYKTLTESARNKLVQRMADSDTGVRIAAIDALTSLGPAIVPTMIRQLNSSSVPMRFGAARVLGNLGSASSDALPELQKMLTDPDALLKKEAQNAIAKIR